MKAATSYTDQSKNPVDRLEMVLEWDVVNWSKAIHFWQENVQLTQRPLKCLELGARRGGLSFWLANMGHEVVCSDLTSPENHARAFHVSVASKIRYEAIDATRIPYKDYFDIVVFKSILGGIARHENDGVKEVVINEIYEALKPQGKLLFAENLNASPIHRLLRKKLTPWGNYWNYLRIEEVSHLFKHYSNLAVGSAGFLGAFGRTEQQRRWLAHLDSFVFDRMLSSSMHYILFGVATK